jgi:uncharacterized repeat protein (TIGR01451 family)
MKSLVLTLAFLMILISAGTDSAWSQEKGAVELKAVAEMEVEVVGDDGQKEIQRVPAEKVVPNDVVIYTIFYTNNGEEAAENFVIVNPVPEHMVYIAESADGENTEITYSVDGGNGYDIPGNLTFTDSEGKQIAAKVSDYTHIRWVLNTPVAPEGTGFVYFKAQIK